MKTYDTYAEAKAAHLDSEIVTTGPDWEHSKDLIGKFQPRDLDDGTGNSTWHRMGDRHWAICNPKDYQEETPWNGEGYPPVGKPCWFNFCGVDEEVCSAIYIGSRIIVYSDEEGVECSAFIDEVQFRPLETPEQRKEREELEAAYDLYKARYPNCALALDDFKKHGDVAGWLRVVRKTNYKIK